MASDRPTRITLKPLKIQTTSSDDEPCAKWSRTNKSQRVPKPMPRSRPTTSISTSTSSSPSPSPSPSPSTPVVPSVERLMETLMGIEEEATVVNHHPSPCNSPAPSPITTLPSLPAEQMSIQLLRQILNAVNDVKRQLKEVKEDLAAQRRATRIRERREQPDFLPLSSTEAVVAFETCSDDDYDRVVGFFASLGGYTPKEAITSAFKEAITDNCANSHTWLGASGAHSLANKRIMRAIFEATLRNPSFDRPAERDFESICRNALKSAKERYRKYATSNGSQIPSTTATTEVNRNRNCWRNSTIPDNNDPTAASSS